MFSGDLPGSAKALRKRWQSRWPRRAAGLSQDELAARAATSRPTLSPYEHGHRSPTLATAARILAAAGYELVAAPRITFTEQPCGRGRTVLVPSNLPRLDPAQAFATVILPLHLNWSEPGRAFDLSDRRQRARVYQIVLREGTEDDVLAYVDGALLVDLWPDLVVSRNIRAAWWPVVAKKPVALTHLKGAPRLARIRAQTIHILAGQQHPSATRHAPAQTTDDSPGNAEAVDPS